MQTQRVHHDKSIFLMLHILKWEIESLVHTYCSISNALAMEILQSCTDPLRDDYIPNINIYSFGKGLHNSLLSVLNYTLVIDMNA